MASQPKRNPNVKYCPVCKSDLKPEPSKNKTAQQSTRYACTLSKCNCKFEINDIT